jgi:dipeptidyl aminopeptidase/acylaminoacyl peptidase
VRTLAALVVLALPAFASAQPLQTVAEKSDYKSTSRSADVVAFCEAVAKRRPTAQLEYFGTSHAGLKLPLLILSDPPVATPAEAKQSEKLVVLVFANIHAGEVDGKEALLALARELTDKPSHPLFKDLVILLVPNLNADGNDKIALKNRPLDNGPTDGAGTRENAQGLDLNRDFVKLESPEVRALVALVNRWDPSVIIDCHTTNGSKHRYTLTFDGPRYPSDTDLGKWTSATFFPEVTKKVKAATEFDIAPYGNFSADRTKWETYPASPRYSTPYFALRGKLAILSESYSYASFKDRIAASKAFVTACLEVAAARRKEITKLTAPTGAQRSVLRTKTDAFPNPIKVLGFEELEKDGKRVATDKPKEYTLDFVGRVSPTEFAELPYAYLVPATETAAIQLLQRHGLKLDELREDIELETNAFRVTSVDTKEFGNPKRVMVTDVTGAWDKKPRRIPAGTVVIRTAQPLGTLAAYLLEPRSEDGFTTWALFANRLAPGTDFAVQRLAKSYPLTLGPVRPLPEARATPQPITEALLRGQGGRFSFGLAGSPVRTTEWIDAEHFLQVKDGRLMTVEARTGRAEVFADPEKVKKSVLAVGIEDPAATRLSAATVFRMNPDRTAFLFPIGALEADLGLGYFDGRPGVRITRGSGFREHVSFSPDGTRIAFVRGNNLCVVDVAKAEETRLTRDGGSVVFNGKADWLYEEEIFDRNGKAYWWSADGKMLAFLRFDDGPAKKSTVVNPLAPDRTETAYAYPRPGDENPHVKIGVVSADGTGKPTFLDPGEYKPRDTIVARVGWMGKTGAVYAYLQNRTQTWLDFVVWDASDAKPKTLFRETTKAWVDEPGPPHYLADGSFLFPSERTGWKHLYHYSPDGKLLTAVTKGEFEVKRVLRADADGAVYFTATNVLTPGETVVLCRGSLTERGPPTVLTSDQYSHGVQLAPEGALFVDRYTDLLTPTRVRVLDGSKHIRQLDTNPVYEREGYTFGKTEKVSISTADGFRLEGVVTYPPNFDEKKKYPLWVFTYAGPHMPSVKNEWGGGHITDQALAASGIVAFRIDPRTASGKGVGSAWACYKQLGVQELKDLEEAVAWLTKRGFVDPSRVGISGGSYGGFMTAYALTHSSTFSAGIADAPVTDWALYDSIYTERYMLTPKENPEGYAKSSCVAAAKNLRGKLLLVHGMIDDNVHVQNTVALADALQRANKPFEMMLYPRAQHGIGGPHFLKLQMEFIRRTMGVAQ